MKMPFVVVHALLETKQPLEAAKLNVREASAGTTRFRCPVCRWHVHWRGSTPCDRVRKLHVYLVKRSIGLHVRRG